MSITRAEAAARPGPSGERELARRVAHELRSPLAALAATAAVLEHELEGVSDRGADLSTTLHRQVAEMSAVLDGLLKRYGDAGSGLGGPGRRTGDDVDPGEPVPH